MTKTKNTGLFLCVVMMLFATDSLFFATNRNQLYLTIASYLVVIVGGVLLLPRLKSGKIRLTHIECWGTISCVIISIIMILRFGGSLNFTSFVLQIFLLIFGMCFTNTFEFDDFCVCYVKVLRVIAIVSLVAFVFSQWILQIPGLPTITNTVGVNFKSIILSNIPVYSQARNWGPYREPGVYQFFLFFGLLISLFRVKEKRVFNIALFLITMLTTASGSVLISISICLLAFAIDKRQEGSSKAGIIIASLAVLIFTSAYFANSISFILNKATGIAETDSLQIRIASLWSTVKAFLENPILGVSNERQFEIAYEVYSSFTNSNYKGITNTYPTIFASYGIVVGMTYMIGTYNFCKILANKKIVAVVLFFSIIISTSNENLSSSCLISVMPFFCLTKAKRSSNTQINRFHSIERSGL